MELDFDATPVEYVLGLGCIGNGAKNVNSLQSGFGKTLVGVFVIDAIFAFRVTPLVAICFVLS